MLRCMLGSVKGEKSENPKRERETGKWNNEGELSENPKGKGKLGNGIMRGN